MIPMVACWAGVRFPLPRARLARCLEQSGSGSLRSWGPRSWIDTSTHEVVPVVPVFLVTFFEVFLKVTSRRSGAGHLMGWTDRSIATRSMWKMTRGGLQPFYICIASSSTSWCMLLHVSVLSTTRLQVVSDFKRPNGLKLKVLWHGSWHRSWHGRQKKARPSHVWLPTFYLFDLFDLQLTCNWSASDCADSCSLLHLNRSFIATKLRLRTKPRSKEFCSEPPDVAICVHSFTLFFSLVESCPKTARNARWHVFASGWKTARVVVLLFEYGVWVGWGGIITFMWLAYTRDATLLLRQWLGVGWGGIITFMWLAYTRDATLLRQWLGVGWCGVG